MHMWPLDKEIAATADVVVAAGVHEFHSKLLPGMQIATGN